MPTTLDSSVATQPVTGVVALTGNTTTLSLVNLGGLSSTSNRTLTQPADGENLQLTVGETFNLSGLTATFTMVGSGTITGNLV